MRSDDPKMLKASEERQRAQEWVNVLRRGIGAVMQDAYTEEIQATIDLVNEKLVPALEALRVAEDAYRPYWGRRRRRIYRPVKKKKAAKK
jgi:hypothetical protein